jgi:hypothetical protein
MFLCPKCSYAYDIRKTSGTSVLIEVDKPNFIFKILDENLDNYIFTFDKKKLTNTKRFNALDKNLQEKLLKNFDKKQQKEVNFLAEFYCTNCGNKEPITKSTKLYEINKQSEGKIYSPEEIEIIINDPTLPRTKNYNCKNKNCETIKNENLKEAVFFKENNFKTYQLYYACCHCKYHWAI